MQYKKAANNRLFYLIPALGHSGFRVQLKIPSGYNSINTRQTLIPTELKSLMVKTMDETLPDTSKSELHLDTVSSDIRASNLIHLLDSEIELVRDERQQPGWTKWAISGSLATSFWLLFNEIEKGQGSVNAVITLLIVISLSSNLVIQLRARLLPDSPSSYSSRGRFMVSNEYANDRFAMILSLLRYITMLYLTYMVSSRSIQLVSISSYIVNGLYLALILYFLLMSFLNIPLQPGYIKTSNWKVQMVVTIPYIIIVYALFSYLSYFLTYSQLIANIRIAGLIAAIYFLVTLISTISSDSPLMNSLIKIRRDFSLGNLEYTKAVEQTDTVIAGLKIADVLQDYVQNVLVLLDSLDSKKKNLSDGLTTIEKIIAETGTGDLAVEQKVKLRSLFNSVRSAAKECMEIVNVKLPSVANSINWRMRIMSNHYTSPPAELTNISRMLNDAILKSTNQIYIIIAHVDLIEINSDLFQGEVNSDP
ncbi:MAG: hypothetical protein WBW94_00840 [Anaerolineales bacterium]